VMRVIGRVLFVQVTSFSSFIVKTAVGTVANHNVQLPVCAGDADLVFLGFASS